VRCALRRRCSRQGGDSGTDRLSNAHGRA
jgi:hypothetical protein